MLFIFRLPNLLFSTFNVITRTVDPVSYSLRRYPVELQNDIINNAGETSIMLGTMFACELPNYVPSLFALLS